MDFFSRIDRFRSANSALVIFFQYYEIHNIGKVFPFQNNNSKTRI